jgi:hypothetical protein
MRYGRGEFKETKAAKITYKVTTRILSISKVQKAEIKQYHSESLGKKAIKPT